MNNGHQANLQGRLRVIEQFVKRKNGMLEILKKAKEGGVSVS